jgi:eukaryotic-like serine/threonine-protein kinase
MSRKGPGNTPPIEIDLLGKDGKKRGKDGLPGRLGDFRIIREIAVGGMAAVYEAEQISLKRLVALKVLPAGISFSGKAVQRFQREAEACGRQSHPGIVSIYGIGETEGTHYIAAELIPDGRTLSHWIDELRSTSEPPKGHFREVATITAAVARALTHAHERQVIHRDIKPSNILMTAEGHPKVSDFGLARVEDALSLSRTGDFSGTPFYMSPEQAMSRRIGIDSRTDIYSLGVTLYEMLTLKRPFEGKTSQEVFKQIIFHEPNDPRKVNPRVPRDLAVICLKAMEKKPGRRYQSMTDFAADLECFLNGEVISARPASLATRALKRIRRNPLLSTTLAAAILVLLVFGGNMLWSGLRIRAERQKAAEVNDFLVTILSSPDPDRLGKDVMVVDVLDRAVVKIEEQFAKRPALRAALQKTVGYSYEALGRYVEAERLFGAAFAINNDLFGPEHQETVVLLEAHAATLMHLGRFTEAKSAFSRILETRRKEKGPEEPETLAAMNNLAGALWKSGDLDGAEKSYRTVLDARRRLLPPNHEETLVTTSELGCFLMVTRGAEALDEAEELLRCAFSGRRSVLGITRTVTLQSMNNLAALLERRNRIAEAEKIYRSAIAEQSAILPPDHSDLVATKNNLAGLLTERGDHLPALEIYREVLDKLTASLGESHPDTLNGKSNLAGTLRELGRSGEARKMMEEILERVRANPGSRYPDRLDWIFNLATYCLCEKDFTHAVPLFREVLTGRPVRPDEDRLATLNLLNHYSNALLGLGEYAESERQLLAAIEIAGRILPENHSRRIALHDKYSLCLYRMKRIDEAVHQVLFCYENRDRSDRTAARSYLKLLVRLCRESGRHEEEKKYELLLRRTEDPRGE